MHQPVYLNLKSSFFLLPFMYIFLFQTLQALYAVKSLLMLRSTNAQIFKDVCKLDLALSRMKEHLQQWTLDDDFKEYALEMENLRKEVELIFLDKLGKVSRLGL